MPRVAKVKQDLLSLLTPNSARAGFKPAPTDSEPILDADERGSARINFRANESDPKSRFRAKNIFFHYHLSYDNRENGDLPEEVNG